MADVYLLGELSEEIEKFVFREYERSGARLDGVKKKRLVAECQTKRNRRQVEEAYELLRGVEDQRVAPLNDWDRRLDALFNVLAVVFYAFVLLWFVAAVFGLVQWLGGWDPPWRWVVIPASGLVVGFVLLFLLGFWISRQSEKVDELFIFGESDWEPLFRNFETALRIYVLEPALRSSIRVRFRLPTSDVIEANGNLLTTTPLTSQLVRTDTYRRVLRQLARADGATIGIRGSRGVGKTDLVRSFCDPLRGSRSNATTSEGDAADGDDPSGASGDGDSEPDGDRVVGIFIPAPTSLDEFAFLRRVALLVCERTLAKDSTRPDSARAFKVRPRLLLAQLAVAALGLSVLLFVVSRPHEWLDLMNVGWLLTLVGFGTLLAVFAYDWMRGPGQRQRLGYGRRQKATTSELRKKAEDEAAELQRTLRFKQDESLSSEGSVAFHGIGAKVVSTVNKSEIPATKDDIVEALSKVIRSLNEAGDRVVVGIDELDKLDVDDEGTTRLLNAMKSLFASTSASFLITISTSAWSSFEQRGIRVRTVFDSSFDDIIEARALSFLDARSLIKRRLVELSDSQILFVNVAAGGIARDLLRYARKLIEIGESDDADLNLDAACATFIERERATALEAAVLDARDRLEPLDAERVIYRLELLGRLWHRLDDRKLLEKLGGLCEQLGEAIEEIGIEALASGNGERSGSDEREERARLAAKTAEYLVDAEARVVAYFTFLRLLERAFVDGGAISVLVNKGKSRYEKMPQEAVDAFEKLRHARENLVLGRTAARWYLADAAKALDKAEAELTVTA